MSAKSETNPSLTTVGLRTLSFESASVGCIFGQVVPHLLHKDFILISAKRARLFRVVPDNDGFRALFLRLIRVAWNDVGVQSRIEIAPGFVVDPERLLHVKKRIAHAGYIETPLRA